MVSETRFVDQIESAYQHLYDLVYLRTHPLGELLLSDPALSRRDRAWRLHRILLEVIEELLPGPQTPTFSHEWRRHRLMVLRYVDGLDPQTVADQIAIGRRQYYREQEAAIHAIARILWDRYLEQPPRAAQPKPGAPELPLSRLELVRLEAARMAQAGRYSGLTDVVDGVLSLLQERLSQRRLNVESTLAEDLPRVSMERNLLRQMLLGMLGYLIERAEQASIRLAAWAEGAEVHLSLTVVPPDAVCATLQTDVQERLLAFQELAVLGGARFLPVSARQPVVGFEVSLPVTPQRTVLVVDDNDDVLELFRRYLTPHRYQVVAAKTAREALDVARRSRPGAITLDLMMPDQDGWDLLQLLLTQPDTRDIPIIVCSVLRQKELALSLGATAFLEKPVSEGALLAALQALEITGIQGD